MHSNLPEVMRDIRTKLIARGADPRPPVSEVEWSLFCNWLECKPSIEFFYAYSCFNGFDQDVASWIELWPLDIIMRENASLGNRCVNDYFELLLADHAVFSRLFALRKRDGTVVDYGTKEVVSDSFALFLQGIVDGGLDMVFNQSTYPKIR
jgi:hypothetical protein